MKEAPKASPANSNPVATDSLKQRTQELQLALNEAIRAVRETDRSEKEERGIGAQERRLLIDIAKEPLSVITERYRRLEWSAHTRTRFKRSLLEKRMIKEERIRVPSGSVTLLKLGETGRALLSSWGVKVKALPKNTSLEHEYWKHRIAEDYRRRGYEVEEEVPIGGGKAVDLVATKGKEPIAIEIETGKSDSEANLRKCKKAGFHKVLLVRTMGDWLPTVEAGETRPRRRR